MAAVTPADIRWITPQFAVASAATAEDYVRWAAAGVRTVINLMPDAESTVASSTATLAPAAERAGLDYRHLPATPYDLFTEEVAGALAAVLADCEGPILAHCRSGQRAAIAWAAASARITPVEEVLDRLASAGFHLEVIRDDLDSQAARRHWDPKLIRRRDPVRRTEPAHPSQRVP